jgi:nucleoid DNA-binding protein
MKFNEYCLLIRESIAEGQCVEILAELGKFKKEELIITIRKKNNLSNEEMEKICENCPNYPF